MIDPAARAAWRSAAGRVEDDAAGGTADEGPSTHPARPFRSAAAARPPTWAIPAEPARAGLGESIRGVILDATGRGFLGGAGGRVDHASVRTEARPLPWGAEGIREEGRGVGQHVAARTIERTHARSE